MAVLAAAFLAVTSALSAIATQGIASSSASIPASMAASPRHTTIPVPGPSVLFEVTSQGWTQAIKRWRSDHAGSWRVRGGELANTGKGQKLCDYDPGKYCRYEALILAPYRVRTTHYAIQADVRLSNPTADRMAAGIVFRAHEMAVHPAPLVIAGVGGILESCGDGTPSGPRGLGMCAGTGDLVSSYAMNRKGSALIGLFTPGHTWHVYRIEVRGKRYRLLIDGHVMEAVTDIRPETDFGDRFGFYATLDAGAPQHISIRSVTVVRLRSSVRQ